MCVSRCVLFCVVFCWTFQFQYFIFHCLQCPYLYLLLIYLSGCDTKADITFIVDSSDDVGKDNFQKQLAFLKQTVNNMKIAPDKTQISVVTFSSGVYNQFFLNAYASKADVLAAIDRIPYISGRTHTSDALTYVTHTSFNPIHGARSNVPHIGVLITDGPSTAKDLTKIQGQVAKDNNIIMYGVGVGSGINMDELSSVSSSPSHRYMLTAENYGALNSLSSSLSTKLCNGKLQYFSCYYIVVKLYY